MWTLIMIVICIVVSVAFRSLKNKEKTQKVEEQVNEASVTRFTPEEILKAVGCEVNNKRNDHHGTVIAVCTKTFDAWHNVEEELLVKGQSYTVEYAVIARSFTTIYLKELQNKTFNIVLFDFYYNGEEFSLIDDVRLLWQMSQPEMSTNSSRIVKYPSAGKRGLKYLREFFPKVPVIERMNPTSEILIPEVLGFDLNPIIDFATEGWSLGDTHGLAHWQKVERNGIILGMVIRDGVLCYRDEVNMKVVRSFAYLHDKCRVNDEFDSEHGVRSADLIYTIRDTILKDLSDDEIMLLDKACRYHTTLHRTGIPTVDVCFDADRLDLGRVGIDPDPKKMATSQGAYYTTVLWRLEYTKPFETIFKKICTEHAIRTSESFIRNMDVKDFVESCLNMIEIKGGTLVDKGKEIQIPTFYITRIPVSLKIWRVVMNDERPYYSSRIEWDEYESFLNELNEKTGLSFSLPTSLQWKYARQFLNGLDVHNDGMNVGIYNRMTGKLNTKAKEINVALLCSMGNGHEALSLFLVGVYNSGKSSAVDLPKLKKWARSILTEMKVT